MQDTEIAQLRTELEAAGGRAAQAKVRACVPACVRACNGDTVSPRPPPVALFTADALPSPRLRLQADAGAQTQAALVEADKRVEEAKVCASASVAVRGPPAVPSASRITLLHPPFPASASPALQASALAVIADLVSRAAA